MEEINEKKPILLNISNHPFETWLPEQKEQAFEIAEKVIDIPFPEINPECGEPEIQELVEQYYQKIEEHRSQGEVIVHIMGEMTFVYGLVGLLRACNIPAIASTTKRIVKNLPDGRKVSKFQFVRFRYYVDQPEVERKIDLSAWNA